MSNRIYTRETYAPHLEDIFEAMEQLKILERELNDLFPERQFLIRQMILAVLTKTNVLIYGIYGTAKSMLIRQFIRALGASKDEIFTIEMTKYTTESDLMGAINVPLMRETGEQRRNPEGTIRRTRFADIGEFFDAPHLSRSLMGALNERYYYRGLDSERIPLHTAFASTNVEPEILIKSFPNSDAVIDRFPYQCKVRWLETQESRRQMLLNFLHGTTPETKVDYEKMLMATQLVLAPTDQITEDLIDPVLEIVQLVKTKWETMKWRQFSDRALTWWLVTMEASALWNGRYDVTASDLHMLRYVICDGGNSEQVNFFDHDIVPIIERAEETQQVTNIDQMVLITIDSIRNYWPAAPTNKTSASDLVKMRRQFGSHLQTANGIHPELPATEAKVQKLRDDIQARIELIDGLIARG